MFNLVHLLAKKSSGSGGWGALDKVFVGENLFNFAVNELTRGVNFKQNKSKAACEICLCWRNSHNRNTEEEEI